MKIKYEIIPNEKGFFFKFSNDPLIEEFFKDTSEGSMTVFRNFNAWRFTQYDKIDNNLIYQFNETNSLYYHGLTVINFLTLVSSSNQTLTLVYNGLHDVKKWESDINNAIRKFVNDVIKPYHQTKLYCNFKGNILHNGYVINKEKYQRHWFSFYKNYKKYILDYCEGMIAQ